MKNPFVQLLVLVILVSSCQKSKDIVPVKSPEPVKTPEKTVVTTTASFKVTNFISDNTIFEGDTLQFKNESTNAESYYWDFGNGTTSTEKIPTGVALTPCYTDFTITLTVKSKSGEVVTYSQPVYTLCKGKHAY